MIYWGIGAVYLVFVVTLGFLLDCVFGDPENVWHPVCAIGGLIRILENRLRRVFPETKAGEVIGGAVLWALTCGLTYFAVFFLLRWVKNVDIRLGFLAEALMCSQLMARRSLADAGMEVQDALGGSLEEARKVVSKYVGRDTSELTEEGVVKAAVETVAENLNDGVAAPVFFMLIGGAPLGFLYKAANTLDSMVGYRNEKYEYFGKFSARMDDFLGFIPARGAAMCLIAATGMLRMDSRNALRVFARDRNLTASPNAGQTESACAGALHISLGGDAKYFGKTVKKPRLGDDDKAPVKSDIGRACDLMTMASVLFLILGAVIELTVRI